MSRPLPAVALALLLAAPAAADPAAEDIRAKVRTAVGYEAFAKLGHGVELAGAAEVNGLPGTFRLRLHPDGRYVRVIDARTGHAEGFDGTACWTRTLNNPPVPTDFFEADAARLHYGLLGYRWLAPGGGFTVELDPAEHRPYRPCLVVRRPGGRAVAGRAYVDPQTWLPTRYAVVAGSELVVEVSDYRDAGGVKVPARVAVNRYGGGIVLSAATAAAAPPPAGPDPFAPPAPAADTRFDPALPAAVEARRDKAFGFLLVRPAVNGQAGPWFLVTTNVNATVATAAAADRLGLPAFGRASGTALGQFYTRYRAADRFTLGPATVTGLTLGEVPAAGLAELSRQTGVEVGGLLGADVLARVVLEADFGAGTAAVHDPRAYRPPPGLAWEPVRFARATPCVPGTFEGRHAGLFEFATGSDAPLLFYPGAVRGLDLLAGRAAEPFVVNGVDGATQAFRAAGAEFRVLGRTLRGVETRFVTGDFSSDLYPYTLGAFGPSALGPGAVVFDYPSRRLGFAPRP